MTQTPTTDTGVQAAALLGQVLCETRHPDVYHTPDGPYICDECQGIAAKVTTSDWLPMFTAYREQIAAAQALDQVVTNVESARPPTEHPAAQAAVIARVKEKAAQIRPLTPTERPTKKTP